ncbi:MAG: hypothetical protein ACM3ZQ_05635 [Bacillota bacterium]
MKGVRGIMPWYSKIQNVDRRVIYILMALAIIIPLLRPIGMPVAVSPATRDAFDALSALPDGSRIFLSIDAGASSEAESKPATQAVFRLCMAKKIKVYIGGTWSDGPIVVNKWLDPVVNELGAKYGEDYINLGYRPSPSAVLETCRTDLIQAMGGIDSLRKPLNSYPIMNGVTKASNFDAVVSINSGDPGLDNYIASWYSTGEVKTLIGAVTAVEIPNRTNQYKAGILKGLIGGLAGSAEFERLLGKPGLATVGMDAQSLGHLVIIVFMVVGNIGFLAAKRAKNQK